MLAILTILITPAACFRDSLNGHEIKSSIMSSTLSIPQSAKIEGIKRDDFPVLKLDAYESKPLIYLDSAATSQKPYFVLDGMDEYYKLINSNVHRGAHALGNRATEKFEESRNKVKAFINAIRYEEIIFTRGATEAINIVALSLTSSFQPGDEIILSVMEHHSNLVPWQMLAQKTGAVLKFIQLTPIGTLDLAHFESLLSPKTKIVSVMHVSNVLGTIHILNGPRSFFLTI